MEWCVSSKMCLWWQTCLLGYCRDAQSNCLCATSQMSAHCIACCISFSKQCTHAFLIAVIAIIGIYCKICWQWKHQQWVLHMFSLYLTVLRYNFMWIFNKNDHILTCFPWPLCEYFIRMITFFVFHGLYMNISQEWSHSCMFSMALLTCSKTTVVGEISRPRVLRILIRSNSTGNLSRISVAIWSMISSRLPPDDEPPGEFMIGIYGLWPVISSTTK